MGLQVLAHCNIVTEPIWTSTQTRGQGRTSQSAAVVGQKLHACSQTRDPRHLPRLRAAGLRGEQPVGQPGWQNPRERIITTAHTPMEDLLSASALRHCRISMQKKHSLSLQIEKSMRKQQKLGGAKATVQTKTLKLSRSVLMGTGQETQRACSQGRGAGDGGGKGRSGPACKGPPDVKSDAQAVRVFPAGQPFGLTHTSYLAYLS